MKVKVKPHSKKSEIIKISEEEYEVLIKSAPEDNKANIELIKKLSKHFKKEVKIVSGKNSRKKVIEFNN